MGANEITAESRAKRETYLCILLRCRLGEDGGRPAWRFTVQQVGNGVPRRSFASFSDLVAYVDVELARCEALATCQTSVHSNKSASVHSEVEP